MIATENRAVDCLPPDVLASSKYTFDSFPTFDVPKPIKRRNVCTIDLHDTFDNFVIACHQGNATKVEQYLKTADYEPNKSDFFGWTPLHAACAGFNFYIIRLLLEHGEDPASMDKRGNSAFQVMIKWNRVDQELVSDYRSTFRSMMKHAKAKHGDDIVNRVFDNQETCLHTAINKAEQAAVDILLDLGADIFKLNSVGSSPLSEARILAHDKPEKFDSIFRMIRTKIPRSSSVHHHSSIGDSMRKFTRRNSSLASTRIAE